MTVNVNQKCPIPDFVRLGKVHERSNLTEPYTNFEVTQHCTISRDQSLIIILKSCPFDYQSQHLNPIEEIPDRPYFALHDASSTCELY